MNRPQVVDSLLAIDIGNTRIGMTAWDADGLHNTRHVPLREPEAWPQAMQAVWDATHDGQRRAVVIASVVPAQTAGVAALAGRVTSLDPLRVRDDIPMPMPLALDPGTEVGVDRVCSACAAYERVGDACAVASFGSAVTIDLVSAEGCFLGGTILPGLQMSCNALHECTGALPRVTPAAPLGVWGRNTHDAIVNGVVYGAVGALREIVERYATELKRWPPLVATGGNAALVAACADFVDFVVPDLCLMGVALAYRRASGQD